MISLLETGTPFAPEVAARWRVRLVSAAPRLWRVLDTTGRVIGHLQEVSQHGDTRFRARRLHPETHAFRDLGDFWSADDAMECLRFAR